MRRYVVILLTGLLFLAGANGSSAQEWIVERISGAVWAAEPGREPVQLTPKMRVSTGATVQTLRNGRVRLVNEKHSMNISPNSIAAITRSGWFLSPRTRIVQQSGTIEFDVETRNRPHFEVRTPYLAAVVKGTKFTISVTTSSAAVSVERGLVGVTDTQTGEAADVGAGQRASASEVSIGLTTGASVGPAPGSGKGKAGGAPGKSSAAGNGKGKGGGHGKESGHSGGKGGNDGNGNGRGGNNGNGNGGGKGGR